MNCEQANKIDIAGFFRSQGRSPEKASGNGFLYFSPFRDEKTASFKVDPVKNVWFDFGTGTGGQLVDLVQQLHNVSVSGALLILSGVNIPTQSLSFEKQNEVSSRIEIKHIQAIKNKALIKYLEYRNIPLKIASIYLVEAYYKVSGKTYFGLAFKNDKGGYELRNEFFKSSSSPKHTTEITGNSDTINLFEGFMDFLSSLVYFRTDKPENTTIILNSVSNLEKVKDKLSQATKIYSFMDNDVAGKKAFARLKEINQNAENRSEKIHPGYKDFNEFLTSIKPEKPVRRMY